MTPIHFKYLIKKTNQMESDWICTTHERFIVRNGRWSPCKKNKNCVVGVYRKPKQLSIWIKK